MSATDIVVAWGILTLAAFLLSWLQSQDPVPECAEIPASQAPSQRLLRNRLSTAWWPVSVLARPSQPRRIKLTGQLPKPRFRRKGWPSWPRAPPVGSRARPRSHPPPHLLSADQASTQRLSIGRRPENNAYRFLGGPWMRSMFGWLKGPHRLVQRTRSALEAALTSSFLSRFTSS